MTYQFLGLAFFAGALLGAFFFGGLWWTVQKGITSSRPELWFLGSLLLRTVVILAGFYVVAQGHWSRLVASILGFLVARIIVVNWLSGPSPKAKEQPSLEKETSNGP